ncbi:hypothetical protein AB0M43_23940 [Longispora sp. NPDC051575]|uniref:deazapurine DNA modification protein DpdA family protein n=1 Tax=Longispora sp. NPDC051575 TaxID=3154943 RepID=UPI003448CACF
MTTLYLRAPDPDWLTQPGVPLALDLNQFTGRALPAAATEWLLHSGTPAELATEGAPKLTARQYAAEVRRLVLDVGRLEHVSSQNWDCSPLALSRTTLAVGHHQRNTISNYLALRDLLGDIVFPVLEGATASEVLRCVDLYDKAGVNLTRADLVGLGSVSRRKPAADTARLIDALAAIGLNLHADDRHDLIGTTGNLAAASTAAWTTGAATSDPLHECTRATCAHCHLTARLWHDQHALAGVAA